MTPIESHFNIINTFPGIEDLRYLEVGVYDGRHFDSVPAKEKTSIDCDDKLYQNLMYKMTTDKFFESIPTDMVWDLIFIDADHNCVSILKDFNNSVNHLAPGGSIFLHDMWPPTKRYTSPGLCGTGYQFFNALLNTKRYEIYTLKVDFGLTFVHKPTTPLLAKEMNSELSYEYFLKKNQNHPQYSVEGMNQKLRQI